MSVAEPHMLGPRGEGGWGESLSPPLPCQNPGPAGLSMFSSSALWSPLIKNRRRDKQEKAVDAAELGCLPSFQSRSFIYFTCGKNQPLDLQFSFLLLPHSLWIHQPGRLAVSQEPDLSSKSLPDVQSHKHVSHWQEPNDKLLPVC